MAGRGAERRVLEGRDGFDEVGCTPQMHRRRGAEPRMQHLTCLSAGRRVPSEVAHSNGSLPARAPVPRLVAHSQPLSSRFLFSRPLASSYSPRPFFPSLSSLIVSLVARAQPPSSDFPGSLPLLSLSPPGGTPALGKSTCQPRCPLPPQPAEL